MKRVPAFWWDYESPAALPIIVESDDPAYPLIAIIGGSVADAQEKAIALIEDLRAGRADYRKLAKQLREGK